MSYNSLVLDASTLILLAKIELLPLLIGRFPVVITVQVKKEATKVKKLFDAQLIQELLKQRRIKVQRVDLKLARRLAEDFRLEIGEASSVVLAKERNTTALGTDDRLAIQACKVLGVPFVTAIHLLIRAVELGWINRSTGLVKLEKLQQFGRYHPRILEDAMEQIQRGEVR